MFIAFEVSLLLTKSLVPLVPVIAKGDADLADQLRRAATSITLNLAEGQRSLKGNKQKHYSIAHGSANEVKAAVEVALAWGWIDRDGAGEALALLDRMLALLWCLTHGPSKKSAARQLAR